VTATLTEDRRVEEPATATEAMVVVEELVKQYPKRPVRAVDGISFSVARGEIFGLLGPNGAGKTTTIGAMTTRVVPTSGRIRIAGVDVARHPVAAKRRFGVVSQRNNLDRSLTARQNLVFHAAYFGFSKRRREQVADALLEEFGLTERANDKTDEFSGGMAQRLQIARALMHEPELLFLDEPATGLDPQSRLFVHDRIAALHARGVTILITTHDMHEAEKLCQRIAIMDHGRILALDRTDELRKLVPAGNALELDVAVPRGASVRLVQGALATSGTITRRWLRGGAVVHHLIDPRTGRPASSPWAAVTVAGATCVVADVAAKAAFLAAEDGPDWLDERGLPGRFLTEAGDVFLNRHWLDSMSHREAA
jgi:ABC-2 type transport system ATP-binding protein